MTAPAGPVACANCGRAAAGRFCPDCGQEHAELRRPFKRLVRDLLADTFAFDARLWRTLPLLVTRPGRLASEYMAGRRARYVPPLRIYLFLGALFFAVLALADGGPLRFAATVEDDRGRIVIDSAFGIHLSMAGRSAAPEGSLGAGIARAAQNVETLNDIVIATLSYAHLLFLPVVALILGLLWRGRWYVEHLIFGMYFFAFGLLAGSAVVGAYALLGNPPPDDMAARVAIAAWDIVLVVMLYPALRDMYGGRRLGTILRFLVLVPGCFLLASSVVVGIAFATIAFAF